MASVAVVLPCYGQAQYLGDALRSLATQTCGPDEVIVVDDRSPDDVRSVTEPYPEGRYIRQENRGLSEARNRGLAACSSDFVNFLDADDRLLPEAVDIGATALASRPNSIFGSRASTPSLVMEDWSPSTGTTTPTCRVTRTRCSARPFSCSTVRSAGSLRPTTFRGATAPPPARAAGRSAAPSNGDAGRRVDSMPARPD